MPLLFSWFALFSDKELRYEDFIYEDQIKTVRLFPATDSPEGKMLPCVAFLNGSNLILEFDDLQSDRNNYYAKILSCNYDWTPSSLHDLDFLHNYNEYNLNDYFYSNSISTPYVHYQFLVPQVKLPGNYLLVIYRDGDMDDLILSKRFMVASEAVRVTHETNYGMNTLKASNQQINFILDYNGIDIPNPLETVNVVIRQNQRWDNAQRDIKPSFVRPSNKTMEYRFFNTDKGFQAGNEFRFVDFRSLNSPGQNVGRLNRENQSFKMLVAIDAPRDGQRYAQFRDLNGNYVIMNLDAGNGELSGNYVDATFTLQSPKMYNSKIYVAGAFSNWAKDPQYEMKYNQGHYTCEVVLKQGYYNYGYITDNVNESVEGNYYETENQYEIFVYNHAFYPGADLLVGYYTFTVNQR